MAISKDVLAVLGMLCVSRTFRTQFFASPQAKAEALVGRLRDDEIAQILALAGQGDLPPGISAPAFVDRMNTALDGVYAASTCPDPPCPSGFDSSSAA